MFLDFIPHFILRKAPGSNQEAAFFIHGVKIFKIFLAATGN